MTLDEFLKLVSSDERWSGITRLPWHDEAFSARMLREHLAQAHDGASRRFETIDRQVRWIHERVLGGAPKRVLDLGCGPGFYMQRLAELGHSCTGIDISPASIAYARAHATSEREQYRLDDMTQVRLDESYDLAMLIHGEFNVLSRTDAAAVVARVRDSLPNGGKVLLEVHTLDAVRAIGRRPRTWIASVAGLFSDGPHLRLDESRWDDPQRIASNLHCILDGTSGAINRYGTVTHAYHDVEYVELLRAAGFSRVDEAPSLDGGDADVNYKVLIASA